jgi:tRNA A-37 threonylcarbamoyl transferase component Bud32
LTQPESNDINDRLVSGDTTGIRISTGTEFQEKQVVGGRYEVISRLGEGGMGLVYLVNQIFLQKEFALKTIDKRCMSEMAIRRFQQEARTAFSLDHPSIIAVNDFGVFDDQTPFLVMELLKGETLGERLKRTGCLTLEQAIPIFVQVCFGLAYAHECGVVHRDIKPNNIMLLKGMPLGAEGSVKIVDFGIAKFTEHEGGEMQALTRTGEIFGSPLYMSPEQCTGARVDHRADIYSLGCVFFEALTGAPPCVGDSALATMMKHQTEQVLTLKQASLGADFPQAIEDIVLKMLAKSPDNRYQNLGIVAHDLGALRRGESISAAAQSTEYKSPVKTISMTRTNFYALLLGIALLAAVTTGVAGYLFRNAKGEKSMEQTIPAAAPAVEPAVNPLSGKEIDDSGHGNLPEEELRGALAYPTANRELVFANRKITDKGFELIANTDQKWIRSLNLHNCDISNESLGRLAKLHLSSIGLNSSTFNDSGAKNLSRCQELSSIDANSTNLHDEGVIKLATIKALHGLSIAGAEITNKSLAALAKTKDLVWLDLTSTRQFTNTDLKALEPSHLHALNVQFTQIDDTGMSYISKIDSLEDVVLNSTKVTVKGVEELCKNSRKLKSVQLIKCPNIGQKELEQLRSAFPAIKFIDKPPEGKSTDND